jgi:hypothetical protein
MVDQHQPGPRGGVGRLITCCSSAIRRIRPWRARVSNRVGICALPDGSARFESSASREAAGRRGSSRGSTGRRIGFLPAAMGGSSRGR